MQMTKDERSDFVKELAAQLAKAPPDELTDDERRWIRMAILRDAQSYEFRRAVIEKTLTGLVWAALCGVGYVMLNFVKTYGGK